MWGYISTGETYFNWYWGNSLFLFINKMEQSVSLYTMHCDKSGRYTNTPTKKNKKRKTCSVIKDYLNWKEQFRLLWGYVHNYNYKLSKYIY